MGSPPSVPRYGEASLADLMPSVLSALGLPGFLNVLGIEPMDGVCLLVVDGLGWELLREHRSVAPFLWEASEAGRPLTAGFPSTTSASLGSLGTGLPPGEHGLIGYTFRVPGFDRPMNSLQWVLYGHGTPVDLREVVVPERFQPHPTVIERAMEAGLELTLVGPPEHQRSGLTRAILRGGRFVGAHSLGDLVVVAGGAIAESPHPSVYAYHPFLDTTAHIKGVASAEWRAYLGDVDRASAALAERLPKGSALVVTGDHGMVDLDDAGKVDVADEPALREGVQMLAGEARARHVYAEPGAEAEVLAAWQGRLGDRMWIVPGEEAIEAGWFGPKVEDAVRPRIGDVVAAARDRIGVFQREVDPLQASLVGHHGSMTPQEQLVPLLVVRA